MEQRELQVLQMFKHPNIIATKRIDIEKDKLLIVFEHLEMNLTEFMKERTKQDPHSFHQSRSLLTQQAQAQH